MLPTLLRKAAGDAGFDLVLGSDAEWTRLGVSGLEGRVWVLPVKDGALLALEHAAAPAEFQPTGWSPVPLPGGVDRVVRCKTPADLYDALRRVRVLLAQKPPLPERRLEERLRAITSTEAEAVVRQRVGQDLFRELLMDYWGGRCAVTGLDVPELLRASHAKPWKDATDAERLDVYNGFLLAVHLDALFDRGLMTFLDDGTAMFSPALPVGARARLVGDQQIKLSRVAEGHRPYLAYHRAEVFREGASNQIE